jgi:sec-independent protein translocase protein TatA
MQPLWAFFSMGPTEMVIVGVIAVLLFGKRLPEVGRSLGRSLLEFKKGMEGIQDEFKSSMMESSPSPSAETAAKNEVDDYQEATAPKFEPPPGESESRAKEPDGESAGV